MTTRGTVYLDIDGVLNKGWSPKMHADRVLVRRLNRLRDARFVLASTWRHRFGLRATVEFLKGHGFRGSIDAALPGIGETQIERWQMCRKDAGSGRWVLLDDRAPRRSNVVRPRRGLSKADVLEVLRKLEGE